MYDVKLPPFRTLVNKPFAGLLKNKRRIIFLWGGRGSGKSVAALRLLILRCLIEPYFKCILIRKVYDTIKESMYEALKDEIETLGLTDLFEFQLSPLEIRCKNGNKFICRGLDKPEKLRSIKEPSVAWYEEGNQITEDDFITVSTTLRANKARFLQEVFSFNPETHGEDFEDFWLYKNFFSHTEEKTFDSSIEVWNPVKKEWIELTYSSIFSTYRDNPFVPVEFIAMLESLKASNPYYYGIFALGNWGNKTASDQFYKTFTYDNVGHTEYIDYLPIHVSFDENVNPYLTMTVHQVKETNGKIKIWQIDEILMKHPNNRLKDACAEFAKRYSSHTEGVFIYGDRTSKKEDVKLEKGQNFYSLARDHLKAFRPQLRIPSINPNVKSRGDFINSIFAGEIEDVEIIIGDNCTTTINDYRNVQEADDGTKLKKRVKDKTTGVTSEKFGHTSDANDYLFIEILKKKYSSYINKLKKVEGKTAKRGQIRRPNRI